MFSEQYIIYTNFRPKLFHIYVTFIQTQIAEGMCNKVILTVIIWT